MLHVDYTATATSLDLLSPHETSLQELCVASSQWNPLVNPASAGMASGADLVVCNHAWGPLGTDPGLLVTNLASGAKQQGFVLLHTLLKGETLGETVAFLTTQSSCQYGLLTQVRESFTLLSTFVGPIFDMTLLCDLKRSILVISLIKYRQGCFADGGVFLQEGVNVRP